MSQATTQLLPPAELDDAGVWRPHVTVATVVPRAGRFLLVEEDIRGDIVLNQPTGHLEPGETLHAAAVRETREETGWDVALSCLLGVQQWNSPSGREFVRFTFAAEPIHYDAARTLDDGIVRALWMTHDEIAASGSRLRSPMILTSIGDWLIGRRLPLDVIRWLPTFAATN